MIHTAFTIDANQAYIVLKAADHRVIRQERIELPGDASDTVRQWHACRAAVRMAAQHGKALRLYSDCDVIDALQTIPDVSHDDYAPPAKIAPSMTIQERIKIMQGWGKGQPPPSDGLNRERSLYFNTVSMLVTLFPGRWDVVRVERERIYHATLSV